MFKQTRLRPTTEEGLEAAARYVTVNTGPSGARQEQTVSQESPVPLGVQEVLSQRVLRHPFTSSKTSFMTYLEKAPKEKHP